MESILLIIKNVEFYIMFGTVLVMAGGLMITMMYEFLQEKAGKQLVPTTKTAQELAKESPQ